MRVLVVSAWDGASGVLTVIRSLAERLRGQGVSYSAFSFNGWATDSRWRSCCEHLYGNQEISLTELLVREHFDIVHLVDTACAPPFNPNVWLRRARYPGGVVCMSQNTIQEVPPDQFAHVFIACSDASKEVLAKTVPAPIRVIPNGVDTDKFYEQPVDVPAQPILAWVGRAEDFVQKDIYGYLHLAASLLDDNYQFWIADVGNNSSAFRLKDWFGDRIHYFSQLDRDQLRVFYNQVACSGGAIVATSTFEGFHLALAEAAACGCPMIAPQVPGLEWIANNKIGLIYERYDGIKKLRKCLEQLSEPEFRSALISDALSVIHQRYNSASMADSYYLAYKDALTMVNEQPTPSLTKNLQARIWSGGLAVRRVLRRVHPAKT